MARNTVEGLEHLTKYLKKLPQEMREHTKQVFAQYADQLLNDLKAAVPRNTGALQSTLKKSVRRDGLDARVGFYGLVRKRLARNQKKKGSDETGLLRKAGFIAAFLEYGTKKMPARPFFYAVWDRLRPQFLQDLSAAIERALQKGQ